ARRRDRLLRAAGTRGRAVRTDRVPDPGPAGGRRREHHRRAQRRVRPPAHRGPRRARRRPARGRAAQLPRPPGGRPRRPRRGPRARADDVSTVAITNQRETTLLWERRSGRAVGPAIVWQDRRTAARCEVLDAELIRDRTGLVPDPYFAATKLEWLLDGRDSA